MFEVEVLVCYWVLLLLYQENVELWFEDEESSMSVSELRYAVYSGKVWKECVELDDGIFLVDEGEGLWLSIVNYFILVLYNSDFVSITISFAIFLNVSLFGLLSITIYLQLYYLLLFIFNFLSAGF